MAKENLGKGKNYCRKCQKVLPENRFYTNVDGGEIDSNGYLSICKACIQSLYQNYEKKYGSIEKALHKLCISLNILFSNEAVSATLAQINTLVESGKTVRNIFGIYKSKLVSVMPTMDKSAEMNMTYQDVDTIYVQAETVIEENPIPKEIIDFWGKDVPKEDILYLENEYANFKKTHIAETYAEIVLLKQVCYTMLDIKKLRAAGEETGSLVKELQALMKTLAVSPNARLGEKGTKDDEAFGLWIADIEENEPAEFLKSSELGKFYRDVFNVEEYYMKYFVRPAKNFITGSKDFNIMDDESEEDLFDFENEDLANYNLGDDEEV